MEEEQLTLKNDILFKTFFSRKGNEKFLQEFLSALLKVNITKIEIQRDASLERLAVDEKLGVLDIRAVVENKTIVSIEMQVKDEKNIIKRSGFYGSKEMSAQVKKKEKYKEIKNVIMVNILGFNLTKYEEYISWGIAVLEKHREYELNTGIKYCYIELPKFRKSKPDMNLKINQWLAFIDYQNRGWVEMSKEKNETIKEAAEEFEYLTGEEEVKRIAFLHEKWERDYLSAIDDAKEERRSQAEYKKLQKK